MSKYYLAIDIGASSGRHMLASMINGKIQLEEVYRFPNGMDNKNGTLCWDVERLFTEIKNGLKKCKEIGKIPSYMELTHGVLITFYWIRMIKSLARQLDIVITEQMEWMQKCMRQFHFQHYTREQESRNRFSIQYIS